MYKEKTFLAIIPARGGSKRLPRKNVLDLAGKPLIAWSIEAAKESQYIDSVLVSSDDDEILSVAKRYGAQSVNRPKELASDTATTIDALVHVLENMKERYDYVVLLQPTSPLRGAKDIDEAIEYLFEKKAKSIVSVCEMEHSPLWTNTLPEDRNMQGFLKDEVLNKRSQDLEPYYRLNGAIYICKTEELLQERSLFLNEGVYAYEMAQEKSIDIDTRLDFLIAESLLKNTSSYWH